MLDTERIKSKEMIEKKKAGMLVKKMMIKSNQHFVCVYI